MCRIAREILPKTAGPIAQKDCGPQEPEGAFQSLVEERLAVSGPIFQLGCKGDAPERGEAGLRQQMLGELACEVLLGNSTPLYARLYQEGLINRNFSYGYDSVPGCAFLRREASPGTRRPSGPLWRRRPAASETRAWTRACGTG